MLYSFGSGADGKYPYGGVIRDAAGNLYGTTSAGGAAGVGCVFRLDASGNETVLHSFHGRRDGSGPHAGVIRDPAGNLFGTTHLGGASNFGAVFKLDPAGKETVLHSFADSADGLYPLSGVVLDAAGNLYGTTEKGNPLNAGVVYEVDATGHEKVLFQFNGLGDGGGPYGGVTLDAAGNLYGTASYGGASNAGVVYMIDAAGLQTVLYSFTGGADGGDPVSGLIRDAAGDLFGTALNWGSRGGGVVFKVAGR